MINKFVCTLGFLCALTTISNAGNYFTYERVYESRDTVIFKLAAPSNPDATFNAVLTWRNSYVPDYNSLQTIYTTMVKSIMDNSIITVEIDTTNGGKLIKSAQ